MLAMMPASAKVSMVDLDPVELIWMVMALKEGPCGFLHRHRGKRQHALAASIVDWSGIRDLYSGIETERQSLRFLGHAVTVNSITHFSLSVHAPSQACAGRS